MASADLKISFSLRATDGREGQPSFKVFSDWYDFADFMKEHNLQKRAVIVTEWEYVHCRRNDNGT